VKFVFAVDSVEEISDISRERWVVRKQSYCDWGHQAEGTPSSSDGRQQIT